MQGREFRQGLASTPAGSNGGSFTSPVPETEVQPPPSPSGTPSPTGQQLGQSLPDTPPPQAPVAPGTGFDLIDTVPPPGFESAVAGVIAGENRAADGNICSNCGAVSGRPRVEPAGGVGQGGLPGDLAAWLGPGCRCHTTSVPSEARALFLPQRLTMEVPATIVTDYEQACVFMPFGQGWLAAGALRTRPPPVPRGGRGRPGGEGVQSVFVYAVHRSHAVNREREPLGTGGKNADDYKNHKNTPVCSSPLSPLL